MNSLNQIKAQLWIAAVLVALIIILLSFFLIIVFNADAATYSQDWTPKAVETILDMIKVLVGAVIGTLTPVATAAVVGAGSGPSGRPQVDSSASVENKNEH